LAIGQVGQVIGVVLTGSLLIVATAFIAGQMITAVFIALIDLRRQFPFLRRVRPRRTSWSWAVAQFRGALPFSVTNIAELGLTWLSVLLIGIFVSDRIAIAQWSLTRTIANLLRQVSFQATLPVAAELGHDHVVGARESLQRLYLRGSVIIVLVASAATSGALPFWPDFFAIWTHGTIPYDRALTVTLLFGTCATTPALLALSFANYSNQGPLLLRAKALQLLIFLALSILLIPPFGPLGAAIALISSDLIAQSGFLLVMVVRETLSRPLRYVLVMLGMMVTIVATGTLLAEAIRNSVPAEGVAHLVTECILWLAALALVASPLARKRFREKLLLVLFPTDVGEEKCGP
jgi:O-antigen/teichoic acid export membrane protein